MKLIAGNAMMRAMAKKVSSKDWRVHGIKTVSSYIETENSLRKQGLLKEGVQAVETQLNSPLLSLRELLPKTLQNEVLTNE